MNKIIRSFIIGFILMVLGIVFMVFGSMNGGGTRVFWHHGHFWVPNNVKINQKVKDINNITIQGDTLDIEIQPDQNIKNGIVVEGNITNDAGFKIHKDLKTLKLNYQNMNDNMPSFSDVLQDEDHLTIKVPTAVKLQNIKISVQNGNIELNQVAAKNTRLNNIEGQIKISQGNINQLDSNNDNGATHIDGLISKHTKMNTGSGNVNLRNLKSDKTQVHIDEAELIVQKSQLGQALLSVNKGMTTLNQVTAQDLFAQSIYGDYNLKGLKLTGAGTIATQSGNITAQQQSDLGYRLVVQNQGKIEFQHISAKKWYQTNFDQNDRLTLTTYRGDIMVDK